MWSLVAEHRVAGETIRLLQAGETAADRPLIAAVHGFHDSYRSWAALARRLGDRYRFVALDLPWRAGGGDGWAGRRSSRWLEDALRLLPAPPAAVLAHSFGAGALVELLAAGTEPPEAEPLGTGPLGTGPLGTGPLEAGPIEAGPLEAGPLEARSLGTRPLEAGPLAAGPLAAGPPRIGPLRTGLFGTGRSLPAAVLLAPLYRPELHGDRAALRDLLFASMRDGVARRRAMRTAAADRGRPPALATAGPAAQRIPSPAAGGVTHRSFSPSPATASELAPSATNAELSLPTGSAAAPSDPSLIATTDNRVALDEAEDEALVDAVTARAVERVGPGGWRELRRVGRQRVRPGALAGLPLLIVHHLADRCASGAELAALAGDSPRARLVAVDGSGHFGHLDDADRTATTIRHFLGDAA